jgi:hypothetical protein
MFSLINKENKQGDMTYDCLLKLVEDSCGKIEQIKMRWFNDCKCFLFNLSLNWFFLNEFYVEIRTNIK